MFKQKLFAKDGSLLTREQSKYYYYRKTFLYSTLIACLITIPFIIWEWVRTGHGIFLYYGDYNAQQIAFYKHCVGMVREGNFGWDWFTDMGSNFVGSYSYYMLGSPFFWIMCLFPASWAPYLMGPMYIIKYIVAAMLAYAYLQRWVKNKNYAVLGSLLYAFCGFQIYNTFFNQFHEVVALFPLLLIGMEEYIQNNRKGIFAIAVCLNAMVNYFMFAGQVAFCIIYFLFRASDRSFRVTVWKFLGLAFEAAVGVAMSMVLFLPGALALLGNDRTARSFDEWKYILGWYKDGELYWQRYGQILESYFFPPDIPSRVNFFYGHTERWASISAYLPMFGMTGVFAFFTTKRRRWLKALIIFLVICSFVPGLNSLFFLGNSSYYARWMYLMVLMFVLATILALDNGAARWKAALAASMTAIVAIAVPLGLLWYDEPSTDAVDIQLGRAPFLLRFWIYTAIAAAGIALLWYLIKHYRGTKVFTKGLLAATAGCIVLYSCVHIINGKEHSYDSNFMVHQVIGGEDVILPDAEEQFYRIDFYRTNNLSTIDNLNIYWQYPSIECFHTVVPPSLMNFYDLLDYNRSVGSRAMSSWYGLRALTSTEYSFIESSRNNRQVKELKETLKNLEEIAKYKSDGKWKVVEETSSVRIYRSADGETIEIPLYDLAEYTKYQNSSRYTVMEDTESYRFFKTEVISENHMEETVLIPVEKTDTETLNRYLNDPEATEIFPEDGVQIFVQQNGKYAYTTYEVLSLENNPQLQPYLQDDSWTYLEPSPLYCIFTRGEETRLVYAENGEELASLREDPEWSEVDMALDNVFVFARGGSLKNAEAGDIDGDGRVCIRDYVLLRKYVEGSLATEEIQERLCDLNGDGYVNKADYEALKTALMGLEASAEYRVVYLSPTLFEPYAGDRWSAVSPYANYRIFRFEDGKEFALVHKKDSYDLERYLSDDRWTELVVSPFSRVYYSQVRTEEAEVLTTYHDVSIYNPELKNYENDSAWEPVENRIGVHTYVKEEFNTEKGWVYYDTQNGYDIYRNLNYLPMGFSFDGFMKQSEFEKISSGFHRSILLCNYLVVPDEKAEYYAQFMTEYVKDTSAPGNEGKPLCKNANYSNFQKAVEERKTMTCTDFKWDSDGFSAKYSSDETDIVFFSVPAEGAWYDASQSADSEEEVGFLDKVMNALSGTGGWKATVGGKEVEILTVYNGFMAVEVPAGENVEIVFTYETFGGKTGLWISLAGLLLFLVYLGVLIWRKKIKADYRFLDSTYYEEGDVNLPAEKELASVPAEEPAEDPTEDADLPIEEEQ